MKTRVVVPLIEQTVGLSSFPLSIVHQMACQPRTRAA